MNADEIREIIKLVDYPDYRFEVVELAGEIYLQGRYLEPDIITKELEWQRTRKWRLSQHMVKSELVQTALLCVLTSAEHRVREHFLYRGQRVFGPHFDVDALHELCSAKRLDYRKQHAE